ncbi:NAD(P)-dependent oxidoreductase [Mucilaginibacter sp. AW1-3]
MNQHITVAVIGATGKAGKYLVKQLLQDGYSVKALIRKPNAYTLAHPELRVVEGDIQNIPAIKELLTECDAVISTLGQGKDEPLISGPAAINITTLMKQCGIKRYIFVCGLNIDVPGDGKSEQNIAKSEWMRSNFPVVVADKQKAYDIVTASDIDWTMVRLPMIIQTEEKGKLAISLEDCPGENINTSDLADFLISQIDDKQFIRKSPFVASS